MAVLDVLLRLGIHVKAAREAAGMSVAPLAELTGMPVDRVKQFESGDATPR
jgi:ribosome-binding protein aMBF1 (putative translation factor)